MRVAGGCRGISDSVPYILELLQKTPGILVLSEHWLWPYELHKLSEISENLKTTGKADARLSDDVSSGRGFDGIGIMWHEGIGASPVEGISSDRICAIRCSLDKSATTVLTVIGSPASIKALTATLHTYLNWKRSSVNLNCSVE